MPLQDLFLPGAKLLTDGVELSIKISSLPAALRDLTMSLTPSLDPIISPSSPQTIKYILSDMAKTVDWEMGPKMMQKLLSKLIFKEKLNSWLVDKDTLLP